MRPASLHILVLHGPNLNLLGAREPAVYGNMTLPQLDDSLRELASQLKAVLTTFQSNHEGELVARIQAAGAERVDFIVINAAAYTHTSIALRDALLAVAIPFIEVHISNIYTREPFRQRSYLSDCAVGVVAGLGGEGYHAAVRYAVQQQRCIHTE